MTQRTGTARSSAQTAVGVLAVACLLVGLSPAAHAEATRRWIMTCGYAQSTNDDPIVFPNQPGATHLHDFYGNVGIDANTTTFDALTRHASNCADNDRSSYWAPALYRNGVKMTPTSVQVYYENKSTGEPKVYPFPPGFRLLMGNSKATTAAQSEPHWVYACSDKTQYGAQPPASCSSGGIQMRSEFPNCWNGKMTAAGDATGNVVWANGLGDPGKGNKSSDPKKLTCPAGYKTPLPMVRVIFEYATGKTVGTITLSSGGGSVYSKHGDFFNGWDPATQQALIDKCLAKPVKECENFVGTTPAK